MSLYECIANAMETVGATVVLSVAIWSLFRYVLGGK